MKKLQIPISRHTDGGPHYLCHLSPYCNKLCFPLTLIWSSSVRQWRFMVKSSKFNQIHHTSINTIKLEFQLVLHYLYCVFSKFTGNSQTCTGLKVFSFYNTIQMCKYLLIIMIWVFHIYYTKTYEKNNNDSNKVKEKANNY